MDEDTALATKDEVRTEVLQSVLIGGDLSKLSPKDLLDYYQALCASLKLNPLTKPFEKLNLGGKVIFYATRNCADQLRMIHQVHLEILKKEEVKDLYIVTVKATLPNGRGDEEIGAVAIKGLQGEGLANAFMKATTKAKRRATLSVVGLSMLDESELDTLPRMERSVTRQLADTPLVAPTVDPPADHTEMQALLLDEIMNTLKRLAPTNTPEDKDQRLHLLKEAFDVKGWSKLKGLTVAQLQTGYAHLRELVTPEQDSIEAEVDDDVPIHNAQAAQDERSEGQESMDSHDEDASSLELASDPDGEIPEPEVDEDGLVTKTWADRLAQRAEQHHNTLLLMKIQGEAAAWTVGQWKYAWVQVGPKPVKAKV